MNLVPATDHRFAIERLPDSPELVAYHAAVREMVFHSKLLRTAMQLGAADLQQALYEQISIVENAARFKELSPHLTEEQAAILDAEVAASLAHIEHILEAGLERTAFQLRQAHLPQPEPLTTVSEGFWGGVVKGLTLGQVGKKRQLQASPFDGFDLISGVWRISKQPQTSVPAVLTADALVSQQSFFSRDGAETREIALTRELANQHRVEAMAMTAKLIAAEQCMRTTFSHTAHMHKEVVEEIRVNQAQGRIATAKPEVDGFSDLLCQLATRHFSALVESTNFAIAQLATLPVTPPPLMPVKKKGWFGR